MYLIANGEYTISVETHFNYYKLRENAEITVQGVSIYLSSYNTAKNYFDAGKDTHIWVYYRTIASTIL